jgi:hypothetical protein
LVEVMDGVGIFLYGPRSYRSQSLNPADYEPVPVPSSLELVRVLQRDARDLRAAKARFETAGPQMTDVRPPSASIKQALSRADIDAPASDQS